MSVDSKTNGLANNLTVDNLADEFLHVSTYSCYTIKEHL